jgi:hypothetical protein
MDKFEKHLEGIKRCYKECVWCDTIYVKYPAIKYYLWLCKNVVQL